MLSSGRVECWGTGALGAGSIKASDTPVEVAGITNAIQVSTAAELSCAVLSSSHVACWGYGSDGALGDGETGYGATPVEALGITDATQVAAGGFGACAVLSSGHVDCWGYNGRGALGVGTTTGPEKCGSSEAPCSTKPAEVAGITNATQVAAGEAHVCAVLSSGHLACWGGGSVGQLGDANTADTDTPVEVDGITNATQAAAGAVASCALLSSGHVDCWGQNSNGELGDGSSSGPEKCDHEWYACSTSPVEVQGITDASELAAGSGHACALVSTGLVDCWGLNEYGQLGDGDTQSTDTPVQASGITSATQLAAGGQRSCAALSSGHLECWGFGGRVLEEPDSKDVPVEVRNVTDATQVTGGSAYSCALKSNGDVNCWGSGDLGRLGDGYIGSTDVPIEVQGIAGAMQLAAGDEHACAVEFTGLVDCWGANESGQLGDGTSSGPETCGGNPCSTTPVEVHGITNAGGVAAGGEYSCAVLSTGKADCWGTNGAGQLGDGTTSSSTSPVEVHGLTTATEVTAGGGHSCALLSNGHADCWGSNLSGQLGDGTSSGPETCTTGISRRREEEKVPCSTTPVEVQGLANASQVAAGGSFTCALLSTGHVDCWGYNEDAQLGDGEASYTVHDTPGEVHGIVNATQIAAGGAHACALLSTGHVECWGWNGKGQLGDGVDGAIAQDTPVEVHGIANATQIAAGDEHTCAVLSTGQVDCWGHDFWGQVGDGSPWSQLPADVLGVPSLAAAVSGTASSLTSASATVSGTVQSGWAGSEWLRVRIWADELLRFQCAVLDRTGVRQRSGAGDGGAFGVVFRHRLPLPDIRHQ